MLLKTILQVFVCAKSMHSRQQTAKERKMKGQLTRVQNDVLLLLLLLLKHTDQTNNVSNTLQETSHSLRGMCMCTKK